MSRKTFINKEEFDKYIDKQKSGYFISDSVFNNAINFLLVYAYDNYSKLTHHL